MCSFAWEAWLLWGFAAWGLGVIVGIVIVIMAWGPKVSSLKKMNSLLVDDMVARLQQCSEDPEAASYESANTSLFDDVAEALLKGTLVGKG